MRLYPDFQIIRPNQQRLDPAYVVDFRLRLLL